ncbi:hypothetical protein Barb6_02274 [Bacteroidales bacterium Barb6]|nr:hypothetical protein Barb6_02274 [Bacteroidales bacterium Barb6]
MRGIGRKYYFDRMRRRGTLQFDRRQQGNSDFLSSNKGGIGCFVLRIINGKWSRFVLINLYSCIQTPSKDYIIPDNYFIKNSPVIMLLFFPLSSLSLPVRLSYVSKSIQM